MHSLTSGMVFPLQQVTILITLLFRKSILCLLSLMPAAVDSTLSHAEISGGGVGGDSLRLTLLCISTSDLALLP